MNCPLCNDKNSKILLELDCGNADNSPLYKNVIIKCCDKCGHIFNHIEQKDLDGLYKYYNEEYSKVNQTSVDKSGDRPGSVNKCTIERNNKLFELSKKFLNNDFKILDIGCANGEFLKLMKQNGFKNLYGIDLSENYVNKAKENSYMNIKMGDALNIPFEDNMFDICYLDQVLEHLLDPKLAIKEAYRVLKKDGYLCISVPNAKSYNENYIFDFFWFLQREHINHFDIEHLKILSLLNGFEIVDYLIGDTPMNETLNAKASMFPYLSVVLQKTNKKLDADNLSNFELKKYIKEYLSKEFKRLEDRKKFFNSLVAKNTPIYIWGIGRELLYLKENTNLNKCNINKFIDSNVFKQENMTIDGFKIYSPEILKCNEHGSNDDYLIITSGLYSSIIKNMALSYNFKGKVIEL